MARARNIKPGFFVNEELVELGFATRLLFIGLWTVADREGRMEDRPKKIKMAVFPADDVNVDHMLAELSDRGFINRYEINGEKYVQVTNWHKHQRPHHTEKHSVLPDANGEITVKEPLETGEGEFVDGGNPPDSLIPDSLIPEVIHTSADKLPTCPQDQIVSLYHKHLPELPKVRLMTDKRKKAIRKFWEFVLTSKRSDGERRATDEQTALDWIDAFFLRARDNDFLMGRIPKIGSHANWQADLDFLLSDKGILQVIEKTREAA